MTFKIDAFDFCFILMAIALIGAGYLQFEILGLFGGLGAAGLLGFMYNAIKMYLAK